MEALIKITENNGKKLVSARELYENLGYNTAHWAKWYKKNILNNDFAIENQDFTKLTLSVRTEDFALTIDFAKRLSMLARTEQGEKIRNYFIEVEKQSLKPLSSLDMIQLSINAIRENQKEIQEVRQDLKELKARTLTRPEYFTVAAYGTIHNMPVNTSLAAILGRNASKICNQKGLMIDKVNDTRWGFVNSYPESVLKEVFETTIINKKREEKPTTNFPPQIKKFKTD